MDEQEKLMIMQATISNVKDLLQKRLNSRIEMMNTLASSPMDGLPEKVQELREREAEKTRAVITEQKDLLELLKMLFPQT
jgi:hypothetical protein